MAGLGRKTFTAGDVLTASQVQGYLQDQAVMVFAGTAARSSAIATPTEGMVAITTDTDELQYYNGSDWVAGVPFGAWTSYTPVLTASTTNPTIGSSVWDAAYCQIGKTVHVRLKLTLGAGFAVGSGAYIFSLPIAPKSGTECTVSGLYTDTSLSNVYRVVGIIAGSVINRSYVADGSSAFLSNISPVAPASSDIYRYTFSYEAA